jgi:hypothetical protein
MSKWGPRIAWGACAVSLAGMIGGVAIQNLTGHTQQESALENLALIAAFAAFPVLGAIVASKQPRNAVAWLFILIGLCIGFLVLSMEYTYWTFAADPTPRPMATLAAWFEQWLWYPSLGLIAPAVLLFPDGRPPSSRWRWLVWVTAILLVVACVLGMLVERLVGTGYSIRNPIGITGLGEVESGIGGVVFGFFAAAGVLCVLSLLVRFFRARGVERQQLKLLAFAAALFAVDSSQALPLPGWTFAITLMLIPIAVALAILRYHLYDIDRIINRTLVYAIVTGSALAVYAGTVFVIGTVAVGSSDNLTVAVATLAAAAVFRPALRWVQAFVDRRFYRRKYDAQHTIDAFGARLREETDLDELTDDLVAVVRTTMQPEHVSVWLRTEEWRL